MKYLKWLIITILLIVLGLAALFTSSYNKIDKGGSTQIKAGAAVQMYHCPMHPSYVADKPGDCPICNMKLVPFSPAGAGATSTVPGQAAVNITAQQEQLIGLKTSMVLKRDLTALVRASGRVAYDPELYVAIAEYRRVAETKDSQLIRSVALKLRQMGLSEEQIKELAQRSGSDSSNNLLLSRPGGTVWVYAQIYEHEIGLVKAGQVITASSIALPGKTYSGPIKAIDSILDKQTRTLRVRAEVSNPEGLLKPEMYLDVIINAGLGNKLAVPQEAVLNTGTRQLVFVKTGPGIYEPREIKTGQTAEGYYEVLAGLAEMEEVVTAANFFIDSESKLKAALPAAGQQEHKHGGD
ncbi:MAG: efflux RND transporter periplasmic adaptor subunit [Candidatus Brocadiia bacterium]